MHREFGTEDLKVAKRLTEYTNRVYSTPVSIKELAEVLNHPPFSQTEGNIPLELFCDYDGVITSPWYSKEADERNKQALRQIAPYLQKFTLWSSRIMVDEEVRDDFSPFPYLASGTMDLIEDLIHMSNPDCQVYFRSGLGKIFRKASDQQGFTQQALGVLEKGSRLVTVGSSIVDRAKVRQLAHEASRKGVMLRNFKYFDTRHVIF